jgi:ribosome-associated heat shock protein Hsp15
MLVPTLLLASPSRVVPRGSLDLRDEVVVGHANTLYLASVERVRIDKWLWAARFFKTRGAATEAVGGGHVQVNGARVKPAREVVVGDRLDVTRGEQRWVVVVTALADRRGPASVAATLYEETAESVAARERHAAERRLSKPLGADLGRRPTKQDRRRLDALRRQGPA